MKKVFLSIIYIGVLTSSLFFTTSIILADDPPVPPSPLYPPEKIVPYNGEKNVDSPVHFQWKADGPEVDKYEVVVRRADIPEVVGQRIAGKSNREYDIDLPEDGKSYVWSVKSCKSEWGWLGHDCDDREFGPFFHFTMKGGETPPSNDSPSPGGGITSPGTGGQGYTGSLKPPIEAKSFEELINGIINFVFWIGVAVAPIMILIAGIMYMTAGGDATKIGKARNLIIYTAIGFAIILFAKGLIAVLESVLGVAD